MPRSSASRLLLLVLAWAAAPALAGCLTPLEGPPPVPTDDSAAVRFIVVGDTGTGTEPQYQVAAAIARTCAQRGCDLVVHTGDILYDVGPLSVDDPQFDAKFERPYGSLGLPVHLVLGNHDVGGDPGDGDAESLRAWKEVGDRNVAYHNRTDRPTQAWHMPARWYAFQHGPVAFAAFDTTAMVYEPLEEDPFGPVHRAVAAQEVFATLAWPANATWRFAVGHHPYVSNGEHGNAGTYDIHPRALDGDTWKAFMEEHVCGRADALLAGHDHDLQWLAPVPSCGETRFLVSGGGAKPRHLEDPARNRAVFQRGATLGYWWLEADGDRLRLAAFDGDGQELYAGTWTQPAPGPQPLPPSSTLGPAGERPLQGPADKAFPS